MAFKWLRFIFADSGDAADLPETTQANGEVSYQQGFGPDYDKRRVPGDGQPADPDAKSIERPDMNGVLRDLSANIRHWQQEAYPDYVPAADNGGVALSYPFLARVRFNNTVYEVTNAAGTITIPTNAASWSVVRSVAQDNSIFVAGQAGTADANFRNNGENDSRFEASLGAGVIDKRESLGIYTGRILSSGSAQFLPAGWTAARNSVGNYTITHNLNVNSNTGYSVTVTCTNDGALPTSASIDVNSFRVLIRDVTSQALTDASFAFNFVRN